MNTAQKIIWTTYIAVWLYIFLLLESYDKESYIFGYLIFGWIPFLIAYFIWRDKKSSTDSRDTSHTVSKVGEARIRNNTSDAVHLWPSNLIYWVGYISIFVIFWGLGRLLGLYVFLFIIPLWIGLWFPKWYMKRGHPKRKIVNFIGWSNLLSWFLPPLGIATAFASFGFSEFKKNDEKKKFLVLGLIGIVLSAINAAAGVYLNY